MKKTSATEDIVAGSIYLITNKINGKQYVGQTTRSVAKRWAGHLCDAKRGFAYPICHAIRKYGADGFSVEEIARAKSLKQLNFLEPLYIKYYDSLKPTGYNLASGGKNHVIHSDTRVKISSANKGNQYCKGRVLSDETKAKIGIANKGRPSHRKGKKHSPESIEKMRIASRGNQNSKGAIRSEETRAKISAARKGKKGTPHTAEFKAKMSKSLIGNQRAKGCKRSAKHKARLSEVARGRQRELSGRFKKYEET
jgi:group I intron endonuclease